MSSSAPPFCLERSSLIVDVLVWAGTVGFVRNERNLTASGEADFRTSLKYFRSDSTLDRSFSLFVRADT